MKHLLLILAVGVLLAACAQQPTSPSNADHFGPPTVGMSPDTGLGSFKGSGSWGPDNSPYQQSGAEQLRGFRGF